jgi:hypothetical protein
MKFPNKLDPRAFFEWSKGDFRRSPQPERRVAEARPLIHVNPGVFHPVRPPGSRDEKGLRSSSGAKIARPVGMAGNRRVEALIGGLKGGLGIHHHRQDHAVPLDIYVAVGKRCPFQCPHLGVPVLSTPLFTYADTHADRSIDRCL